MSPTLTLLSEQEMCLGSLLSTTHTQAIISRYGRGKGGGGVVCADILPTQGGVVCADTLPTQGGVVCADTLPTQGGGGVVCADTLPTQGGVVCADTLPTQGGGGVVCAEGGGGVVCADTLPTLAEGGGGVVCADTMLTHLCVPGLLLDGGDASEDAERQHGLLRGHEDH